MKKRTLFLIGLSMLLFSACTPDDSVITVMIHPEITGCSDFGVRHCMQIKYEEDATEWELFPHPIEGFDFEPGYDYVLDVRVTVTNTAPKYELVKIITKTLH